MITVFTPTFNRCYIINKLYQSLLNQTNINFEWVIVDDGSTDDTELFFNQLISKDNPFNITYIKQVNGGKHRAINAGVKVAKGDLFFIVDSDDYLVDDAIEKLIQWSEGLDGSKKWAGIAGARGYTKDKYIGDVYKKALYVDAKNNERDKFNLNGDKAEAYFTNILRKYPFPEYDGENFISEEVVWNAIAADGYYIRWYNEIIYICNYLDDGLTNSGNSKYVNNPQGVLFWTKLQLKVYPNNLKKKYSAIYRYYTCVKRNKKIKEIAFDIGISWFICLMAIIVVGFKRKITR